MADILGKYKFIRKLGKGTYGEVVLVQNEKGEELALKMILKKNLQESSVANLEGEIKCMTEMDNKYIMKMYDVEEDENYKYLICEYCNGGDLLNCQAKKNNRIFSLDEAVLILTDVVLGLFELHLAGYLHRDIKSQNIIIKKDQNNISEYKLADFGFAKKQALAAGTILGSEPFMAPEIYSEDHYGFEVDMWAFGVIFYFMLNMEYPFKLNPHVMIEKRTQQLRKLASSFDYTEFIKKSKKKIMNNCTEEVTDLFKRMFDPNPDKRITFSEIRQHSVFAKNFPEGAGKSKFLYENKMKKFKSNIAKGLSIMGPPSRGVTKRVGTPERLYIEAEHDKIVFLIDSQKQLHPCEVLSIAVRESLSYNLTKYFIILFKKFISRLTLQNLKEESPNLNWNEFCQRIEFKKLQMRYKSELDEAQLKLSTFYDQCKECLNEIQKVNEKFGEAFTQQVTETEFTQQFKYSYRGSTGKAYETLVKFSKEHPESNSVYLLVIISMCHAYNKLLRSQKDDLSQIFSEYGQYVGGSIDYIDFEHLRGWLAIAEESKLKKIIKKLIKKFF